jgi:hypothetical protein
MLSKAATPQLLNIDQAAPSSRALLLLMLTIYTQCDIDLGSASTRCHRVNFFGPSLHPSIHLRDDHDGLQVLFSVIPVDYVPSH